MSARAAKNVVAVEDLVADGRALTKAGLLAKVDATLARLNKSDNMPTGEIADELLDIRNAMEKAL